MNPRVYGTSEPANLKNDHKTLAKVQFYTCECCLSFTLTYCGFCMCVRQEGVGVGKTWTPIYALHSRQSRGVQAPHS